MNISNMKNIIVLKNLPSNLVEEAIVVLKENKKVHKYQVVEKNNDNCKKEGKEDKEYIIKEAEMLIKNYAENLEKKSPKWKNNMKKLEKRYKNSIKLNLFLFFTSILGIIFTLI